MHIANHIPSTLIINGSINTDPSWKTNVLKKAISAEIAPLLSAVKKLELNILNPVNINANEKILNACTVKSYKL